LERISRASKTLARTVEEEDFGGGGEGVLDDEDNLLVLLTGTLDRFFNAILRCSQTARRRLVNPPPNTPPLWEASPHAAFE
jgi:hypothetical protein